MRGASGKERKERERFVAARRKDPLPPGVWVVRADGRYAALRILGPGLVELWRGRDDEPEQFVLSELSRGWWGGSQLTFAGPGYERQVIGTIKPGSLGMADVGDCEQNSWQFINFDDDVFLEMVELVLSVFRWPWLIARALSRRRVRNQRATAALPVGHSPSPTRE
ncbi:MAG: hypothetical protein ACR2P2_04365 [Nakamurella sp.]